MARARRAVIVGGGPAGLATARALHLIGEELLVVERNGDQDSAGVGITLWPNGIWALERLGMLAALSRQAAAITAMAMRTDRDRLLFGLDLEAGGTGSRHPSLALIRARLLGCLRGGLPATIVRGDVTGFRINDGHVVVRLGDGHEIEGDYLVGADGEHSVVRRQLFGPAPGRHAGYVVWRGIAPIQPYGTIGISWLGKGVQFGAFPLTRQRTYWFATAPIASGLAFGGQEHVDLPALFADWPQPIRQIVGATSPARLLLTHPFVYPRLASWASGPVALVGDAAHPMEPTLGQGACLAFEDAVVLAQNLSRYRDVGEAGVRYVAARRKRADAIAARAHAFGRVGQWRSRLACTIRDLAIAAVPDALHRRQVATMFAWCASESTAPLPHRRTNVQEVS